MPNTTRDEALTVICRSTGSDPIAINDESRLIEDLGLDALDVVELTIDLEEAFGIEIADEQVEGWQTIGDVIRCVEVADG